ncbi:hypothetical protein [Gracilimonas sediminicola]|uniref:Por secretion system C-terminal sorting domain-containing protein n=1 Tax=Gracilimonas sediminicola TaxID=2952158 RepID=A0A9X2L2A6_9BACT|nr:hypothetical protein [Gracilimonas sediminicola]MCP9291036.1 hypothetical protein [Gracilimonas sediminicola]
MRIIRAGLTAFFLTLFAANLYAQASFERAETNVGTIGLSITNYGTIGKPDVRNNPEGGFSMRYPSDSQIEHLFEAGIWIGALYNNSQLRVSTSSITTSGGYSRGGAGFEFTADNIILRRSSNPDDEFFSAQSVGEQDIITEFSDRRRDIQGTPISGHDTPLYADVRMESYNWGFPFTENFSILKYEITNNSDQYAGAATWDSVFVGMYADLVVRDITTNETGGAFFNKNGIGYLDSLYTTYAFDAGSPAGEPAINTYGAITLIGAEYRDQFYHPKNADYLQQQGLNVPQVGPSYWLFSAGTGVFDAPSNDIDRFTRMAEQFPIDSTNAQGETYREALRTDGQDAAGNYISFLSMGPFPVVEPGETITVYFVYSAARKPEEFQGTIQSIKEIDTEDSRAILTQTINSANRVFQGEDVNDNGVLDPGEDTDGDGQLTRYLFPTPPDNPKVRIQLEEGKASIYWDRTAEFSVDRVSGEMDFEGYRIYSSQLGDGQGVDPKLIREFDKPANQIAFDTGFEEVELDDPVTFEDDTTEYWYRYELDGLLSGWQYEISVTAFDGGSETFDIGSLESSTSSNSVRIFPGTPVNENFGSNAKEYKVGVYPNPYRIKAAWDGSNEDTRKLYFYNLPARAEVRVYTVAGDIVAELEHNSATYNGDISWFNNFSDDPRVMAGGEHAWDLQSDANQILSTGLYLFSVKDLDSGEVQTGKLLIIK